MTRARQPAQSTRVLQEQRREQVRRKRAAAGTLSEAFPAVSEIRIQLSFKDATDLPPSAQIHAIYPSAPAHFEFACPYGDCDGMSDLGAKVTAMAKGSARQLVGAMECPGHRPSAGLTRRRCSLHTRYRIDAKFQA